MKGKVYMNKSSERGLFMYHHLFAIPPDDDARIGIETLGTDKVSLQLESKMNSTQ